MIRQKQRFILLCILWIVGYAASAQTELIVRLDDDYSGPLRESLESGVPQPGTRSALFASVQQIVQPLLANRAASFSENIFVVRFDSEAARMSVASDWANEVGVRYVQVNGTYEVEDLREDLDDEPFADSLTHLRVIRADEAWQQTQGSPNVLIAIVDTGLYFDHPDFQGQIWSNAGEIPNNGIDDDGNGFVDDVNGYDFVDRNVTVAEGDYYVRDNDPSEDGRQDHGTLTAGSMSAALGNDVGIAGVAPGAKLVPVRAFGRDGVAEDDDIAAAIVYAADIGADVINLSFGRDQDSPLLHEAIQYAYSQGSVVVASGGNAGGDAPHYPSDYAEVIGVAWFTADGTDIEGVGGQFGPGIDLGAPGTGIFTTLMPKEGDPRPIEEQQYGRRSGSSLAAPQVSGAAALLRSIDQTLSPEAIRGILTATARDVREPGWDHHTAAGLLDVANAIGLPYPTNVSISSPEQDGGTAESSLAIIGSAIAPLFSSWRLEFASFDHTNSDPIGTWQSISGPFETQIREATLGTWQTGSLAEGTYLLRLVVELTTGQTLEDRRRVSIDRSAPSLELTYAGPAYFDGRQGVLVEVESDDITTANLEISQGGTILYPSVIGQERENRHGLFWDNTTYVAGSVSARIVVTNASGLSSENVASVVLSPPPLNSALFSEVVLDVPSGYLMEKTTDFDNDGLPEIVFNRLVEGQPSDTVFVHEWAGEDGFLEERRLLSPLIPRDTGDSDQDDRKELLFQFGANTYLLEANARHTDCASLENTDPCFPETIAFEDLTPPSSTRRPLWGARLTDLDDDGLGEIVGHDLRLRTAEGEVPEIMWRILEWDGSTYSQVAELENPTSNSDPEEQQNSFSDPRGLVGDFDGDGKLEWLTGDNDGDYILYEREFDNQYGHIWSFETDRFDAGSRLVQGDFDGDGVEEFWGMTTPKTAAGIEGAAFGLAQQFDSNANDSFNVAETVAFQSLSTRYGTMASADFDGDGIDELVVVHSPDLWVLSSLHNWQPIFHSGVTAGSNGPSGLRSIRAVVSDFSGNGTPELLVSGADGRMRLFSYNGSQSSLPPPNWTAAYAMGSSSVRLEWTTMADSVSVYAGAPGQPLDLVGTTADSFMDVAESEEKRYALIGWHGAETSVLGSTRNVRPHEPASIIEVRYPGDNRVGLVFSEVLSPLTSADQFSLNGTSLANSILLQDGGRGAVVAFDDLPIGAGTVEWANVFDAEGTPLGQTSVVIEVPTSSLAGTLLLESWEILSNDEVRLVFNESLSSSTAMNPTNYRVDPTGSVASVSHNGDEVIVRVEGRALGATGLQTTIVVENLMSTSGQRLAPEGNVATLSAFANDLSDVYIFPNPFSQAQHMSGRVVIAGLPREATIEIYSLGGEHVRSLEEFDGDGGAPWDLMDKNGQPVPSGIYLVRVESEGSDPVLEKVAVIR